jgi:hypothetical protein
MSTLIVTLLLSRNYAPLETQGGMLSQCCWSILAWM